MTGVRGRLSLGGHGRGRRGGGRGGDARRREVVRPPGAAGARADTKYLPAAAQYALAAARAALADGGRPDAVPADRRGLLLATGAGLASLFDAMDATVAEDGGAAHLSPATAPYFAVNVLGNRLAAELELKGFALTVATARTAAADALSTGALALAAGRCDTLVLAAAEEPLPAVRGGGGEQGAAAFTLEPLAAARARGARVHGTLRARSLFVPPGALRDSAGRERAAAYLSEALADLLLGPAGGPPVPVSRDLDLDPDPDLDLVLVLDESAVGEAVALAVAGAAPGAGLPATGPRLPMPSGAPEIAHPPGTPRVGCLGPAFALAHAVTSPDGPDRLVVCATGAGHVALVRVSPARPSRLTTQEPSHAEVA
ncbi:putative 3-oxoacyl-ACP synthase II [Streptomyces avermitilis MA-4680 = NBRC 14893]|uniref:3-oxoacyl-ACP synthase II n=2 Tax=Streptomyces avermitilis TaxID=33903 RepID=Q79Z62_STRAW|nr:3-oxoacyl-(acyl carrier protein) synthase II [Streptomyces avermitilis]BAC71371.1 putative 3-oxoacyl-ACP synthase II [Streptomyces avermitilis MA-4680 = NBRC 14893]